MDIRSEKQTIKMTVAIGASVSGAVDIRNLTPVGIITPADLASTTVLLVWSVSMDGTNWYPLHNSTGAVTTPCVVGTAWAVAMDPWTNFPGWRHLRFVTAASGGTTAVVQATTARTFSLVVAPVL